ncbi:MAG TPA: dihydrodipicolinate reductase [Verrucomicrobiae bacterium]|nr:dihydrodipicolinate reductase [Verrucomicrobiae bacterium]
MNQKKLRIAQFGLGSIGLECLKFAATREWSRVVGAVDIDPAKVGRDLGILSGNSSLRNIPVSSSLSELQNKPDLIFHTSVSSLELAFPQLARILTQGINVVSSSEELSFPQLRQPELAARLDRISRRSGARLVGTGVNPGFVMDLLPVVLASVSRDVTEIHVQRVVNASTRREPLQRKIGSGLDPAQFRRLLRRGQAGHAGLKESLALIAHSFGHRIEKVVETRDAIVARKSIETAFLGVRKGETCGVHQRAEAFLPGKFRVSLDLKMYLDANDPHDAVQIVGDPPLDVLIRGGVAGDQATVAALVNTAPRLMRAAPGLRLISQLPLV